jgi:hypothetical protein
LSLFIFQFLNHYFMNKAKFSYATVALKQRYHNNQNIVFKIGTFIS